jgi:hypothetical protein
VAVIIDQGDEHHAQAYGQPVELLDEQGGAFTPVVAGAVKVDDADAADDHHQGQQQPVKILD